MRIYICIADLASGANDEISAFYIYHHLEKCVVHRKSARGEGHVPPSDTRGGCFAPTRAKGKRRHSAPLRKAADAFKGFLQRFRQKLSRPS